MSTRTRSTRLSQEDSREMTFAEARRVSNIVLAMEGVPGAIRQKALRVEHLAYSHDCAGASSAKVRRRARSLRTWLTCDKRAYRT